ncbi:MAG: hypothetical protein AAFY71_18180 [Bacteroidota bacterium]
MTIHNHTFYYLQQEESGNLLIFRWKEAHANMSYEDFIEACTNYVGYGFEYQSKKFLIDTSNFQFQIPEEFSSWKKEIHHPRYRKLGVERVAYLMPESALPYMKDVSKEEEGFEIRYFGKEKEARDWLAMAVTENV